MELIIDRKWKKHSYTISNLYIDGKWFCNCLEDADRGLDNSMSEDMIITLKKPSITAIPRGTYEITLDVTSPKFSRYNFYKEVCNGKLPRLKNVKGFDGILIHCGSTDKNSSGCLLVGLNKIKGQLVNSKETFKQLYKLLQDGKDRGEKIVIKIK
jgi:hypothetical protein